jgi:NhaA family Na+:H+ antiporter
VDAERAPDLLRPPFLRAGDHALGDGGPALVIFGDYEDPDSAAADRAVNELRTRWDGFSYAWRHLPLAEHHPHANGAALAAEGAAAQDAFWAYHHILLARQDALTVPDLLAYAGSIGLDVAQLMDDMREGRHVERILDDIRSAVGSGVTTTPALFVESVRWEGGWEPDALEGALRAAMAG